MSSTKELLINIFWVAFGRMGVSLAGFFLVPLYTLCLNPDDFGVIDLLQVTVVFLLPIVTVQTGDAIQTFLLKDKMEKGVVMSNSIFVFLIIVACCLSFYSILDNLLEGYAWVLFGLLLFQGLTSLSIPYYKGINKVKTSSIISFIETIILVLLMFWLLYIEKKGIQGYMIAILVTRAIGATLFFFSFPAWKILNLKFINKKSIKTILLFSLPLIPNMIGWWINNLSDRYIINYFLGNKANGIYAISAKFPSILYILASIIISGWMITALKDDRKKNTRMFRSMSCIFTYVILTISLVVTAALPYIFDIYVQSDEYQGAIEFIPLLMFAGVFSSISSLFGITYLSENDTAKAAYTTLISGGVNIICNLILIPLLGIYGAVIGTYLSFLIIVILRYFYVKKSTSLTIPKSSFVILIVLPFILGLIKLFSLEQDIFVVLVISSLLVTLYMFVKTILKIDLLKKIMT